MILTQTPIDQVIFNKMRYKELLEFDIKPIEHDKDFKLLIVVFEGDACQEFPHFHVIDAKTCGNKINAAYDLKEGKFLLHGSVISKLSNRNLKLIQKIISSKHSFLNRTVWRIIYNCWNSNNNTKISKITKVPVLNNVESLTINKQYTYRKVS